MCTMHYQRLMNGSDMDAPDTTQFTAEERFWSKVTKTDGCWEWTAHKIETGYGRIRVNGKIKGAHRYSWELTRGPIPDGMEIDHMCHNRSCVNPEHLRACGHAANGANRAGPQSDNTSGYRGVSWHKHTGKWAVNATINGRQVYGGIYADIDEANRAAIRLREKLHGEMPRV